MLYVRIQSWVFHILLWFREKSATSCRYWEVDKADRDCSMFLWIQDVSGTIVKTYRFI